MHPASNQTVQFAKAYRTEQIRAASRSRTVRQDPPAPPALIQRS